MLPWQSSSCSVLSWVPSEICAGRLVEASRVPRGKPNHTPLRLGAVVWDEGLSCRNTEPKQIGEGTQDNTEGGCL